jgi:hypothetical protein
MKRVRALLVGVLLVLPGTLLLAEGMQMQYADLFNLKGKVIAKGVNTNPVGPSGVTTYRIEELTLTPGTTINVNGSIVQANTAWRVVLVGNAFQVRDLPAIISIDGRDLPPGQESANLQEIAAITFDRALIRNNAVLALSYGTDRTELPERVKLDR